MAKIIMSAGIFVKQGIFVIRWIHCLDIVAVEVEVGLSVWSEKCIAWGKCSDLQVFTDVKLCYLFVLNHPS